MNVEQLIAHIKTAPDSIAFEQVMETIAGHYRYTPTRFTNGMGYDLVVNDSGTNEGSCKSFAFGLHNGPSEQETLVCFGDYYRRDVLLNPDGDDHAHIRSFMRHGWEGIAFDGQALQDGN